jgi:CRP-like cAMP-binding protein
VLISPSLQAQITRSLFTLICKCSKILGPYMNDHSLLEELGFMGAMLQPVEMCPEDSVVKQGDHSHSLFFVLKGRLKVKIVNNFNGTEQEMPELERYAIFGEVSYVLHVPRTATVICDNYVSLMQLHSAAGYNFPKFMEICKQQYSRYTENFLIFAKKLLTSSIAWLDDPIVDDKLLQSICYNLKYNKFKKGQVILCEGQALSDILIIQNGLIDLTFKTSLIETNCIQRLYPGCTYGSQTFFVDEESDYRLSKFSLVALTDGSYLSLAYQALFQIGIVDERMTDLVTKYRAQVNEFGFPLCDFQLYRVDVHKKRKASEIFI